MKSWREMRIKEAAINYRGTVYSLPRPNRHHDIINHIAQQPGFIPPVKQDEQGFLTECGHFVRRKAAARIAKNAGQCGQVQCPGIGLLSEDLW